MVSASRILAIADSHFTPHLLGPGEQDVPPAQPATNEGDAAAANQDNTNKFLPENLVEDFLDEASDMLEELEDTYAQHPKWDQALVFGFVDGVLAAGDDSWSTYEDSYYEDAGNADFKTLDAAISQIDADFDGLRPWDEAAKGYIRKEVKRSGDASAAQDQDLWTMCAHGFIYGADAGYDQEWKVIVTPAGNALVTDEDSITEAALAQIEAESGSGSLLGRVFDMMGIDLNELEAAVAEKFGDGDATEVEGETPIEVAAEEPGNNASAATSLPSAHDE